MPNPPPVQGQAYDLSLVHRRFWCSRMTEQRVVTGLVPRQLDSRALAELEALERWGVERAWGTCRAGAGLCLGAELK